ncbi:glycosyltransferase family 2 protein [Oceanisphaera ostreae]|uniref:Glycosyltransferase family 2 protein n=1 Tax=Oceanisphaera ostreae TaxID=914151 RepID=A0ABW3KH29_9GAMM
MRNLRDEKEILSNWKGDVNKPVVSICCTTYNHESYIAEALKGFLIQETDFPFEILIHDDASTDRTASIIREYEVKYPKLIKSIYQSENQFSKGKVVNNYNFRSAKGHYLALCHGDDFWFDKEKLAKQVSVMKEYGASISGHPAKEVDVANNELGRLTGLVVDQVSKFDARELIKNNGNMLPFGSIMISNESKQDMIANMPPVMFHSGIQMLGALRGGVVILPDVMLAYRVDVPGSTTEIMLGDIDKKFSTTFKRVASIKHLKKMYSKKYTSAFDSLLAKQVLMFTRVSSVRLFFLVLNNVLKGERFASKLRIFYMVVMLGVRFKAVSFLKFIFRLTNSR